MFHFDMNQNCLSRLLNKHLADPNGLNAACEEQEHMGARSDHEICVVVRDVVTEAASQRSLDRFEVW